MAVTTRTRIEAFEDPYLEHDETPVQRLRPSLSDVDAWRDVFAEKDVSLTPDSPEDLYLTFPRATYARTGVTLGGLESGLTVCVLFDADRPLLLSPPASGFTDIGRVVSDLHASSTLIKRQAETIRSRTWEWADDQTRAEVVALVEPPLLAPPILQAVQMLDDLKEWTGESDHGVARLAGIGRTTRYDWIREGRSPNVSTVRQLYAIHALFKAIVGRMSAEDFRVWLNAGAPSPRECILGGELDRLHTMADTILLKGVEPQSSAGYQLDDEIDTGPSIDLDLEHDEVREESP